MKSSEEEQENIKEYVKYLMDSMDLLINIVLKLKNLLNATSKMHSSLQLNESFHTIGNVDQSIFSRWNMCPIELRASICISNRWKERRIMD